MTDIIIRDMYTPLKDNTIRSRHGYLYGICPRMFYYACRDGIMFYYPQDMRNISYGSNKHKQIQSESRFSNYLKEEEYRRTLPNSILGITHFSIHADLSNEKEIIEIKPRYSIKAYYQTLLQRFVCPEKSITIYEYVTDTFYQIKASYPKALEKISRMLVSLKLIPPRFPQAFSLHKTCIKCYWREECYSKNGLTYDMLDSYSRIIQTKLSHDCPPHM